MLIEHVHSGIVLRGTKGTKDALCKLFFTMKKNSFSLSKVLSGRDLTSFVDLVPKEPWIGGKNELRDPNFGILTIYPRKVIWIR